MSDVWAATETDGDRQIKRRAGEYADEAARIASDLRALSQISDADSSRLKKVRLAHSTAHALTEQLEDLRK